MLLAQWPADAHEAYRARVQPVERTGRTITTVARLRKALDKVRTSGYALLDQDLEVGLRSTAAPVSDARSSVVLLG